MVRHVNGELRTGTVKNCLFFGLEYLKLSLEQNYVTFNIQSLFSRHGKLFAHYAGS